LRQRRQTQTYFRSVPPSFLKPDRLLAKGAKPPERNHTADRREPARKALCYPLAREICRFWIQSPRAATG
jgi:hypothetical protein